VSSGDLTSPAMTQLADCRHIPGPGNTRRLQGHSLCVCVGRGEVWVSVRDGWVLRCKVACLAVPIPLCYDVGALGNTRHAGTAGEGR
jgi:hypothetical protein